jgi:pentatricopeptide repeat protein
MWEIVREMSDAGVPPNQVTCSILLKNLNSHSAESDISVTMNLLNSLEEPMDEVLVSSVVEACVRIGKPDLLSSRLQMLEGGSRTSVTGAHTYGSLIKAYGRAGDIAAVWRCWKEMRSRHIKPSSITLGCMVEAVVENQDAEGAYDLIQQVQEDEKCQETVNSVMYCSVLKGFARERKLGRVWNVYEEMEKRNVEMSVVTYNTLIDACARAGRMESVPKILQSMKKRCVRPNLITYSTMVKGHCQSGDVRIAFELVEEMKQDSKLKPDEIMYNSLLDGCARNNMYEEGLRVLQEMQDEGVQLSNFTLSVLVKLMNRAYRVDQAFSLVQDISKKYKFKLNVHVYTNLIQACISNRQVSRAMDTLETMVKENVYPDSRTYKLLVRGSIASGCYEQADALLRGALGLQGAHWIVARAAWWIVALGA